MVAPLVGLLGAAALSPLYKNYTQGVQGRRLENMAGKAGVDLNTAGPQELTRLGLTSGMLNMDQAIGAMQNQQSFDEGVRQFGINDQFRRMQEGRIQAGQNFSQNLQTMQLLQNSGGMMDTPVSGPVDFGALGGALSHMESGGNYSAIGPKISNPKSSVFGQEALGKYQIMEGNVCSAGPPLSPSTRPAQLP